MKPDQAITWPGGHLILILSSGTALKASHNSPSQWTFQWSPQCPGKVLSLYIESPWPHYGHHGQDSWQWQVRISPYQVHGQGYTLFSFWFSSINFQWKKIFGTKCWKWILRPVTLAMKTLNQRKLTVFARSLNILEKSFLVVTVGNNLYEKHIWHLILMGFMTMWNTSVTSVVENTPARQLWTIT